MCADERVAGLWPPAMRLAHPHHHGCSSTGTNTNTKLMSVAASECLNSVVYLAGFFWSLICTRSPSLPLKNTLRLCIRKSIATSVAGERLKQQLMDN